MAHSRPRIGIVSSRPVVLAGLRAMLAEHQDRIEVVDASTQDGHLAGLDAVVYDLVGYESDPAELQHLLQTHAKVIGVEPYRGRDLVSHTRRLGVVAVVPLTCSSSEIADCILGVTSGEVTGSLVTDERPSNADSARLSPREYQVLAGIAEGMSNAEIAARYFIGINTVKTNIRHLYRKIGVSNRAQAVGWFLGYEQSETSPRAARNTRR